MSCFETNFPMNTELGGRYLSSKRSSGSGANKSTKARHSDQSSGSVASSKYSKNIEKELPTDADHNRPRKRTSSAIEDTQSQHRGSSSISNPSKKRRRIP